ncbi:MAG TPA: cupin domain-containing protein [Baekduia sp.]|nr:cupin domain-containing protein [Baekduia sp.]
MANKRVTPEVLLRSEQTDGAASIIEIVAPAEWDGPPLHHHDFDEAFRLLEGTLTFQVGDEVFTRSAGEFTFIPRGIPHAVANLSPEPARYLLTCTPGGFERMFDRLVAESRAEPVPEEALKPYLETVFVGTTIGEYLGVVA